MKPQTRCSFQSTAPATDPIADSPKDRFSACFCSSVHGAARREGIDGDSNGRGIGGGVGATGSDGAGGLDGASIIEVFDVPLAPTKETYSPRAIVRVYHGGVAENLALPGALLLQGVVSNAVIVKTRATDREDTGYGRMSTWMLNPMSAATPPENVLTMMPAVFGPTGADCAVTVVLVPASRVTVGTTRIGFARTGDKVTT